MPTEMGMGQLEFKDIVGYEGIYRISNYGEVYSYKCGRNLKLQYDKDGYLQVGLYKSGKCKYYRVHRLVAVAFLDNPTNKPMVNHKNSVRDDNRVCNLEWVTCQENNLHALVEGNRDYSDFTHMSKMSKKRWDRDLKPILMYTLQGEFIREFINSFEASNITGIKRNLIVDTCNSHQQSTHGYVFRYK